ncbi:Lrp/AsnC family transcriptional regulator [Thermococcus sibiricus]|uniref:Lrp/AsnC family transcriptional regulator n=1 Tax=Thermococcus sibiricus TaxID=172049 RepID=UPI000AAE7ACB|nr:Lrp/AsnC family transcriptional regulator [Thermococcus sibiricus]
MKEIEEKLGKKRPTIKYMINRLRKLGILRGFMSVVNDKAYNRGFCGIAEGLNEEFIKQFKEHEIMIGILKPEGYLIEWYFTSDEDIYQKIFEFSKYVNKFGIYYFDMFESGVKGFSFANAVRKDEGGYKSILDF